VIRRRADSDISPEADTEYAEFWAETEPPRRGRHSRRRGGTDGTDGGTDGTDGGTDGTDGGTDGASIGAWPVRLLALLVGVLAFAVSGGLVFDLQSSRSPAAEPKATVAAEAAPAPAGPVEVSLMRYLDDVGVTSNGNPTIGNLDGNGESFSAQELAARGVRGGSVITYNGVPFRWPDAAVGEADNVTAAGQALTIGSKGSTLAFLVTAGHGPAEGTAKVVYANGSTQKFTIGAPDWMGSCLSAGGPGVVVYSPHHDGSAGPACLFYGSVRLQSAQPVTRIILPDLGPPLPHKGDPSLHIFAITIY
jgi:hypothetical protein